MTPGTILNLQQTKIDLPDPKLAIPFPEEYNMLDNKQPLRTIFLICLACVHQAHSTR